VASGAETVAHAAGKAKTGLIAGGAAAAGVAATVLLKRRADRHRKVLGVSIPGRSNGLDPRKLMPGGRHPMRRDTRKIAGKVADAANAADRFGQRVSKAAKNVKQVSETVGETAKNP